MFAVAGWLPPAPPTPPPPEGYHVLLIHFPIALLLVAPLFILLGALVAARWQGFAVVAALLMILGTAGTWVAVSTGETARDVIEEASDDALDVLEHHEELGELTRNVYTGLTAAYVIFVFLTLVWSPISKAAIRIPLGLIFVALSAAGALYLAGTAHLGGRLVHEFGIRAKLAETAEPASQGAAEHGDEEAGEAQNEAPSSGEAPAAATEEKTEQAAPEATAPAGEEEATEQPAESATESPTPPAAKQSGEASMEPPAETPPPADSTEEKPAPAESSESSAQGSS
ncbi:DUF2231 domain-containing protein [Thermopirellula anaerolimosa]